MDSILIKDIAPTHISKVVKFTINDPALMGYKHSTTPKITVVGVLSSYVKKNNGTGITLHVGNGQYFIEEVWQELLEISFPTEG